MVLFDHGQFTVAKEKAESMRTDTGRAWGSGSSLLSNSIVSVRQVVKPLTEGELGKKVLM